MWSSQSFGTVTRKPRTRANCVALSQEPPQTARDRRTGGVFTAPSAEAGNLSCQRHATACENGCTSPTR